MMFQGSGDCGGHAAYDVADFACRARNPMVVATNYREGLRNVFKCKESERRRY